MFGKRCLLCGLYIKFWQKSTHERWHAMTILKAAQFLCDTCFQVHGKAHVRCEADHCKCHCMAGV